MTSALARARARTTAVALAAAAAVWLATTVAVPPPAIAQTWDAPGWGYEERPSAVTYSSPHGTFDVGGSIGRAHGELGGGTGQVGYPVSTAVSEGGPYAYQRFERAVIYTSGAGAYAVHDGPFRSTHESRGGGGGALGYPTSRQIDQGGGFAYQVFERGVIYVGPRGAFVVTSQVLDVHTRSGGGGGILGYPVGPSVSQGGGFAYQAFERGVVYVSSQGAHAVTGSVLVTHAWLGGGGGSLGYPVGATVNQGGGFAYQVFERGVVYVSHLGSHSVRGGFLGVHNGRGGGGGELGYPRGSEVRWGDGSWTQGFERGDVRIADGRATVTLAGAGGGAGGGGSTGGGSAYYANCDAVRAAGKSPLYSWQPGYRAGLDRDGDGVACE